MKKNSKTFKKKPKYDLGVQYVDVRPGGTQADFNRIQMEQAQQQMNKSGKTGKIIGGTIGTIAGAVGAYYTGNPALVVQGAQLGMKAGNMIGTQAGYKKGMKKGAKAGEEYVDQQNNLRNMDIADNETISNQIMNYSGDETQQMSNLNKFNSTAIMKNGTKSFKPKYFYGTRLVNTTPFQEYQNSLLSQKKSENTGYNINYLRNNNNYDPGKMTSPYSAADALALGLETAATVYGAASGANNRFNAAGDTSRNALGAANSALAAKGAKVKSKAPVEVEKDELIFRKDPSGRVRLVADFQGGKTHSQGGEDFMAQDGDIIFPGRKRKQVLNLLDRNGYVFNTASFNTEVSKLPEDTQEKPMNEETRMKNGCKSYKTPKYEEGVKSFDTLFSEARNEGKLFFKGAWKHSLTKEELTTYGKDKLKAAFDRFQMGAELDEGDRNKFPFVKKAKVTSSLSQSNPIVNNDGWEQDDTDRANYKKYLEDNEGWEQDDNESWEQDNIGSKKYSDDNYDWYDWYKKYLNDNDGWEQDDIQPVQHKEKEITEYNDNELLSVLKKQNDKSKNPSLTTYKEKLKEAEYFKKVLNEVSKRKLKIDYSNPNFKTKQTFSNGTKSFKTPKYEGGTKRYDANGSLIDEGVEPLWVNNQAVLDAEEAFKFKNNNNLSSPSVYNIYGTNSNTNYIPYNQQELDKIVANSKRTKGEESNIPNSNMFNYSQQPSKFGSFLNGAGQKLGSFTDNVGDKLKAFWSNKKNREGVNQGFNDLLQIAPDIFRKDNKLAQQYAQSLINEQAEIRNPTQVYFDRQRYQDRSAPLRNQLLLQQKLQQANMRNASGGSGANLLSNMTQQNASMYNQLAQIENNENLRADQIDQANVGILNNQRNTNASYFDQNVTANEHNRAQTRNLQRQGLLNLVGLEQNKFYDQQTMAKDYAMLRQNRLQNKAQEKMQGQVLMMEVLKNPQSARMNADVLIKAFPEYAEYFEGLKSDNPAEFQNAQQAVNEIAVMLAKNKANNIPTYEEPSPYRTPVEPITLSERDLKNRTFKGLNNFRNLMGQQGGL